MRAKKLLVMAGGTGGHIFPALAVVEELKQQDWQIEWLGTADRMEADLVPKYGIPIHFISVSGIKGKGKLSLLKAPWMIVKAVLQARVVIKKSKPDVVLGMGGYVSGPGGLAAFLTNTPLVIHEQNGVAGLTNKWLSIFASKVLQAFPSAFKPEKVPVVGNPVRREFFNSQNVEDRYRDRTGPIRVLVVGGSQGAKVLNEVIPHVASHFKSEMIFRHQTGKNSLDKVIQSYQALDVDEYHAIEFIDDIVSEYAWADVVVCRSGALTVSEISAIGVAAIFVPFEHKDKQQYWNAKSLTDKQAAILVEQREFNQAKLIEILSQLNRTKLTEMALNARILSKPNASQEVAKVISDFVK